MSCSAWPWLIFVKLAGQIEDCIRKTPSAAQYASDVVDFMAVK